MDAPETIQPAAAPNIIDPQMDTNRIYEQEHERPQQVSDDQPIQLAQNDMPTMPTADTHHIVQAPDGAKVAFPKGTSPKVMHQEMTKWWEPHLQRTQAVWDSVRHAATNAAQVIGLPSDMPEWQKASDEFVRDPVGTTGDVVGAIVSGFAHGLNSIIPNTTENKDMVAKAQAEYAQGNHLAAAVTMSPMVGDGLAKAVKQAQARDYVGSLGTSMGLVLPFLTDTFKGEGELPITREKPVQPTTTSYEHTPDQSGQFGNMQHVVTTKDLQGNAVGHLAAQDTAPGEVTERFSHVDEAHREQGKGTSQIRTLVNETAKNPELHKVHSDISTTPAARGSWEKFAKENPDVVTKENIKGTPRWTVDLDKVREKAANAPEFNGEERRGTNRAVLPTANEVEQGLKTGQPVSTIADQTVGAQDTINRGVAQELAPKDADAAALQKALSGSAGENALYAKAKAELGPEATPSEVAQRAQAMKIAGTPTPEELPKPPMEVRHWSKGGVPLTETDPEKFGTGRAGAETARRNDEGFIPRTYFGMEGYKEPAVQSGLEHKASLDSNAYYDKDADPHGIWKANFKPSDKASAATNAERAVKEAGYSGYYSPEQQVLASFNKVPVRVSELQDAANAFNKSEGRPPIEHKEVGPSKSAKIIADAYDKLQHDPHNPEVQKTYAAMKDDIDKQWDFATNNMGVKFEPWDKEGQPYANSKEMVADVKNNHHLNFFRGGEMPADHPLAAVDPKTGFTYNEKMRAVHDLFGHAVNGNQFGPAGEERAWQEHRQMFSPEAVPAVTTETRGQNSWTNFGKHLRDEAGNIPAKGEAGYVSPTERPYAQNKAGILPEWTHRPEGTPIPDEVAKLHNEGGGSTYNPLKGNMDGKDAFAVPTHPELSKVVDGTKISPADVEAYMKQPKVAAALAANPNLSVGTWAHDGKTYYDLSVTVPDRDQAITLGKKNNQIAIRDLKNGVDIATQGTGTPAEKSVTAKDLWTDETGTYTSGQFMKYLAKNKLMSKAGSETLDAAAKKDFVPGWAEVSQFLTPEDRAQASKSVQKNVVDLVNKFNPEWVSDAAKAGSAAKGWYSRATGLIQHMFGEDAHRFTNFVASLSPQKDVEQNFTDALNFYNMWQDAGKPLGPENEKVIRDLTERAEVGMSGQVARNQLYENLVNEVQPTGPKVSNFARNLKGNMDAVTKDRWMAYLFGNNERMFRWFKEGSTKPAVHLAADALVRAVGQSINMLPAEVQETSWSFLRTVVNLTEKEKISPKEAIGRVNDTLIREGASDLTRLIADSPKVQSALNRLATATGDERFRADNLQNSPRFKQLLQEHQEQPSTGGGVGAINRAGAERGVKQAIKARSEISQAKKAKAAPIPRTETTQAGYRAELGTKRVGKDGKVDVLTELPISSLKMPEGNKLRAPDVAKYKADIAAGKGVDYPVVVPQDGTNIVDNGNHRIEALRQSGSKKAQVWVRQPVESESRPANKAPKDKATEFNPEDMSENIRPALSERMKNALS